MNIVSHNIAFAVVFFWILSAVSLSSIIGSSQSALSIPHILERLNDNLRDINRTTIPLPPGGLADVHRRIANRGIYSWNPRRWDTVPLSNNRGTQDNNAEGGDEYSEEKRESSAQGIAALLVVTVCVGGGASLSFFTPPDGWNCRNTFQMGLLAIWVLSVVLDFVIQRLLPCWFPRLLQCPPSKGFQEIGEASESLTPYKWRFRLTFVKDLVTASGTVMVMTYVHIGICNSCPSWTNYGRAGLTFPQEKIVATIMDNRRRHLWPTIVGTTFGILFLFTLGIILVYLQGVKVLLQPERRIKNGDERTASSSDSHPPRFLEDVSINQSPISLVNIPQFGGSINSTDSISNRGSRPRGGQTNRQQSREIQEQGSTTGSSSRSATANAHNSVHQRNSN
jgi:hypothetical protein